MSIELYSKDELDAWKKYEDRKAMISSELSPDEYQNRCREIAEELGI